jgi:hypothetical protein
VLLIALATFVGLAIAIAGLLATASGAVDAVGWAADTFGPTTVKTVAAFVLGAAATHAAHVGLAARRRGSGTA